jgi:hypothetical protein
MSFAQKEWPGGGRILMAGISTANAVSPKQKLLSGGVALATPTDVGQPLQSRIVAKPRLFAASYPRRSGGFHAWFRSLFFRAGFAMRRYCAGTDGRAVFCDSDSDPGWNFD